MKTPLDELCKIKLCDIASVMPDETGGGFWPLLVAWANERRQRLDSRPIPDGAWWDVRADELREFLTEVLCMRGPQHLPALRTLPHKRQRITQPEVQALCRWIEESAAAIAALGPIPRKAAATSSARHYQTSLF